MDKISFDLLKQMMQADVEGLVSIYLPTWRSGNEASQSRIQLKNILREAEERLAGKGFGTREAQNMLKPAAMLLEDTLFWQNQEKTLAIFVSPDSFKYYKLPISAEETLVVGNRYYIRPLIKYLSSDTRFNVLTVSQSDMKLFSATPYGIDKMEIPELNELIEDYVPANELRQEATSPKGAAGGSTSFLHGYNEMSQTEKNEITKLLRSVDKEVVKILKDTGNPLVVYSVDYLFPMYREVSSYPHLMEVSIKGSPDDADPREMHAKAWEIVSKRQENITGRELEKYMTLKGTDSKLAGSETAEIAKSALHGGVDRLFIAENIQQWGSLNEDSGEIILDNKEGLGHQDLLDLAAVLTMEKGGKVYVLDNEKMPILKPAAAVFRF
jgi:hypothetical protein